MLSSPLPSLTASTPVLQQSLTEVKEADSVPPPSPMVYCKSGTPEKMDVLGQGIFLIYREFVLSLGVKCVEIPKLCLIFSMVFFN